MGEERPSSFRTCAPSGVTLTRSRPPTEQRILVDPASSSKSAQLAIEVASILNSPRLSTSKAPTSSKWMTSCARGRECLRVETPFNDDHRYSSVVLRWRASQLNSCHFDMASPRRISGHHRSRVVS